jgi:hypothetical protein
VVEELDNLVVPGPKAPMEGLKIKVQSDNDKKEEAKKVEMLGSLVS